jgi:beta-glucosidase
MLLAATSHISARESRAYPTNFEWGSALSAHQTEGLTGGGENGDWYVHEHRTPSPIKNGDTADLATDFWHRYPEDLEFAKSMGLTTVRTSIAWEKVEPAPGQFNEAVLDHYRDVLLEMRRLGLKPMLALHHFTHPRWFIEKGHWLSPESPHDFARYTRHVVERLGDLCDLWITFNEPMIDVLMGYGTGENPPNLRSKGLGFDAGYNLVRAHRMATAIIHEIQGESPDARGTDGRIRGVGIANSWQSYQPLNWWNPLDILASKVVADTMNWAFMRAAFGARWKVPFSWLSMKRSARELPADDLDGLHGSPNVDWIGVNYYSCYEVGFHYGVSFRWQHPQGLRLADNGWAICPGGMEKVLRETARKFPGIPLLVTENGLSDAEDSRRPKFIRDHLEVLDRVIQGADGAEPLDVRGYFHWSLTDNFEWNEGYRYRFGLSEIRYDDGLRRVPRESSRVYAEEIEKRLPDRR